MLRYRHDGQEGAFCMIAINKQLAWLTSAKVTPENFPRLFDGKHRVRDIGIIETDAGIDIQTVLDADEIRSSVADFLRRTYQRRAEK